MIFVTQNGKEIQVPSDYTFQSLEKFAKEIYQQGRADGYSQAENDYFAQSEKDREDIYNCGYAMGRADLLIPYDVESIEDLIENVQKKARVDAIDEFRDFVFGTHDSDTIKIMKLQRWLKEK